METSKIYTLIDPRTGVECYVGRTVQPLENRLKQHIHKSKRHSYKCATWIRELAALGLKPVIVGIDTAPLDQSIEREKFWTRHFLDKGLNLLNDGIGRGGCNYPKKFVEWNDELDAMLGKIADDRIAEIIGTTRKSVAYRREKLGIPASFDRTRNTPPPPMGGHNKIELPQDVIDKLGTMSDKDLAELAGVSKRRIMGERHKLNIPSYAEQTGNTGQYQKGNFPQRWKT